MVTKSKSDMQARLKSGVALQAARDKDRFALADISLANRGLLAPESAPEPANTPTLAHIEQAAAAPSRGGRRRVVTVALHLVFDNPYNMRASGYDADIVAQRAASMKADGQMTPCAAVMNPPLANWEHGPGTYALLDGGYRRRALESIGAATIDLQLEDVVTPQDFYRLSRVYNKERDNGSVLDDAMAWTKLLEDGVYADQEALAVHLGVPKGTVSKTLSIARLPKSVHDHIREAPEAFSMAVAYQLTQLSKHWPESQLLDAVTAVRDGTMTRTDLEERTRSAAAAPKDQPAATPKTKAFSNRYKLNSGGGDVGTLKEWNTGRVMMDLRIPDESARAELVSYLRSKFGQGG